MKKFFLLTLLSVFSFTAFAGNFNFSDFRKLYRKNYLTTKSVVQLEKYIQQNKQFGKVSNREKLFLQFVQLIIAGKATNSFESLDNFFKTKEVTVTQKVSVARMLYMDGLERYLQEGNRTAALQACSCYYWEIKNYNKALQLAEKYHFYYFLLLKAVSQKNKQNIWKYGRQFLLDVDQYNNTASICNQTLINMFKYKPRTISKEQQIVFLEQLSQMYPIPGTDFTKWKGFMGFLGYKYKALTGKDIFPESK